MKIKAYLLLDALLIMVMILLTSLLVYGIKDVRLNYEKLLENLDKQEEKMNLEFIELEYYEN